MTPDQAFAALAAGQLGCGTTTQAHECGLTRAQVQQRLRAGRFERLGWRTLKISGSPASWEQQLMAALLDLEGTAVVSRRAAACLLGFDGFERGPIELSTARARRGRRSPWTIHTTTQLPAIDRTTVGLFACTSATRTILDLARDCRPAELERAIDSAIRDGLSSPTFLSRRLAALRGPGRHGVRLLDDLMLDSGGHSKLERSFLRLVRRAGLPRPSCQRIFRRDGRTVARVDFSFEPALVVAEVSGGRGHSSPAERAKDARRRNELQALHYVVLEFTCDDVERRPDYVLRVLREHLA